MQCRYKEKLVIAGDMIFGAVFATWRKAGARRGKFCETSEVQKKNNDKRAEEHLKEMIHTNFDSAGFVMHPTYDAENEPDCEERMEKDLRNLIARAGRVYKRKGADFKWLAIRAYGEGGRAHMHIYLSGGVEWKDIIALWRLGRVNADSLEFDECGISDLSRYTFDQRHAGKRRWSGSRNLQKPAERTNVTRYSKTEMQDLSEEGYAAVCEKFSKRYPGYWLSEQPRIERNSVDGSWYMTFVMYRPQSENLMPHIRARNSKRYCLEDGIVKVRGGRA